MNLNYFVGGVNGVGKTTLLDAIGKKSPKFRVVKGSEELMKWLGIPGDYDALRALPQETKKQEWWGCLGQLMEENAGRDLLLDAHYLNLIDGEVSVVTDIWMDLFDVAVLVWATPEEILGRIQKDERRQRALFAEQADELAVIGSYLQATEAQFQFCIHEYELTGFQLNHHDGQTDIAVQEFLAYDAKLRTT